MSGPGPFEEVKDPKRAALVSQIAENLAEMELDQGSWGALWLADLSILRVYAQKSAGDKWAFIAEMTRGFPAAAIAKTFAAKERRPKKKQDNPPTTKKRRCKTASDLASERDDKKCLVTKVGEPLETAHIYPFSLGAREGQKQQHVFWGSLEMFWSKAEVMAWRAAVLGPEGTETVKNLMTLSSHVHALWSQGRLAFKPISVNEEGTELTVVFYWLPAHTWSESCSLFPPPTDKGLSCSSAQGCKLFNCMTEEVVSSGDTLVFKTDDPAERPLPSVEILRMQWNLVRVQALCGAADIDRKIFRPDWLPPGAGIFASEVDDDDDDDEDDDDDDNARPERKLLRGAVGCQREAPRSEEFAP